MGKFINTLTKAKGWFYIIGILLLLVSVSSIYFLYSISLLNGIENMGRMIAAIGIIAIWIFFFRASILALLKRKNARYARVLIFGIIYFLILLFISFNIMKAYGTVDRISSNKKVYSSSIVTLSNNKVSDISKMDNKKIGMMNDKTSVEGYTIPQEIMSDKNLKNKIANYKTYTDLLDALLEGKVDYVFLPTGYVMMFKSIEKYADIGTSTKIIYSQTKEVKEKNVSTGNSLTEPFTILLMGVDSEEEDVRSAAANGDSLMLITFNPKTLNSTIVSIPRDSYVPIVGMANNRKNKITHAAWYGDDGMIKTIENFTGIKIDYYMKVNFQGAVKLVDTLGGIEADVPFAFCEQNSKRLWGDSTIYVEEGKQVLNGEQALAFSRHREEVYSRQECPSKYVDNGVVNDFVRGQNQQEVVKGLLNKAKGIRSLDTIYKVLETLGNNLQTNMTTNEILSLYNIGKDILKKGANQPVEQLIGMQRLYISGSDAYIYDYDPRSGQGTRMTLYNFVPSTESLKAVTSAMKQNLGLEKQKVSKEFSFDIEVPYEETIIGQGLYGGTVALLPNFIGDSQSIALSYGNRNGIKINVKTVSGYQAVGTIVDQSISEDTDIEYISSMTITVVGSRTSPAEEEEEKEPTKPSQTPSTKPEEPTDPEESETPTTPDPSDTPDIDDVTP